MSSQAKTRRTGGDTDQPAAVVVVSLITTCIFILGPSGRLVQGEDGNSSRPVILGGQPMKNSEFPFLVSIQEITKDGAKHRCTGSIINDRQIITSAKCIEQTANELFAQLGCVHINRCKFGIGIARIFVHPNYYLSRMKHIDQFDLAVLVTSEPIEFDQDEGIWPIEMNISRMDPKCKRRFMLAGVGRNASSGVDSFTKFRAAVVHPDQCAGNKTIPRGTICVHSTTGLLPDQYIGSALIAQPQNKGETCQEQNTQLIGVVSIIGQNLTSTVTDLNVTFSDLKRIIS